MRFAAACGLLRLFRRYDDTLPHNCYIMLASTVQDPVYECRRRLRAKIMRSVAFLQTHGWSRAAKIAAVLCHAAPDPADSNREAALGSICEYVRTAREAADRAVAAAAERGTGGGHVQQGPEALVPWAVYLCAHHPDFPEQQQLADAPADVVASFSHMLQYILLPLLKSSEASPRGSTYPLIAKMLLSLLRTQDATPDADATGAVHAVADLGLRLLDALRGGDGVGSKGVYGQQARAAGSTFPGQVALPRRYFRMAPVTGSRDVIFWDGWGTNKGCMLGVVWYLWKLQYVYAHPPTPFADNGRSRVQHGPRFAPTTDLGILKLKLPTTLLHTPWDEHRQRQPTRKRRGGGGRAASSGGGGKRQQVGGGGGGGDVGGGGVPSTSAANGAMAKQAKPTASVQQRAGTTRGRTKRAPASKPWEEEDGEDETTSSGSEDDNTQEGGEEKEGGGKVQGNGVLKGAGVVVVPRRSTRVR